MPASSSIGVAINQRWLRESNQTVMLKSGIALSYRLSENPPEEATHRDRKWVTRACNPHR